MNAAAHRPSGDHADMPLTAAAHDRGAVAPGTEALVQVLKVWAEVLGVILVALSIQPWRRLPVQGPERQEQELLIHKLDDVGESGLLPRPLGEPGESCEHGLFRLWCGRVSRAGQAGLLSPFPLRALPRFLGTTGRPATRRGMAVARHWRFASATHHAVRPRWASRVPASIPFRTCRAL